MRKLFFILLMCCFLSLDALFSLWAYILKRRGLKEVAGVCGVCGQSHDGCAKASGKHTISCKLCALKTINCLFLGHDRSWRVFHISCFYHVPSSHGVDATEVCHLFHSWLHFYCGFLLCTQRTKGSASSYDLQRGEERPFRLLIWYSNYHCVLVEKLSQTVNQLLFSDFLLSYSRQWLLFCFFSCDLSWKINLHFLILKRFSLGCPFSKLLSFLIECTMLTLGCRDCHSRLASWGAWEAQSMSPWFSTATFCQCFSRWFRCGFSHMVWLENRVFLSVGFHRSYRPQMKCQASMGAITGALRMWWFVTCYIIHWNCTK